MVKPDRRRQIDAVIDYFVGARAAHTPAAERAPSGKVFTTDGPFAETKEQIGGSQVVAGGRRPEVVTAPTDRR
jgi:hypothetical protein